MSDNGSPSDRVDEEQARVAAGEGVPVDSGDLPSADKGDELAAEGGAGGEEGVGQGAGVAEEDVNEFGFRADEMVLDDDDDLGEQWGDSEDVSPIEEFVDASTVVELTDDGVGMDWYILKVQVNRENAICDALRRRVKVAGMDAFFGDVLVPTEDVREYTKAGKQRIVKRKLYPGYVVVKMKVTEDSWFLVRETEGIGDFTGASGKPVPLTSDEVSKIIAASRPPSAEDGEEVAIKTAIPFKLEDRVRVKEGYFQNYEGEVSNVDERNGRVTVLINIFGRPNPVELDHWHVEKV